MIGAGNGTRTRDIKLGKLALYQLSYARSPVPAWQGTAASVRRQDAAFVGAPGLELVRCGRYTDDVMRREDEPLYFFPDEKVTGAELREILESDDRERRAWAISHLLRYAQWEDIWRYVSRDEVRSMFDDLELGKLRDAWARMLKVDEAPVG